MTVPPVALGVIAFGAGSDISEFQELRSGASTARYSDAEAAASAALQGIPQPTIALIRVRASCRPRAC
jgi:enoyl-CoA hydratase/carnithine racemase